MKIRNITNLIIVCTITILSGAILVRAEDSTSTKIIPAIKNNFERRDVRNMRVAERENIKDLRASTTIMFKKLKDDKKEALKKMRLDVFTIRKNALERELRVSLTNLTRSREKISDRITRAEASGRNMTQAKTSLIIADEKLSKAKLAIDTFASTTYTTASITASSTELNLDKPRKIGDAAIKAVKDARDALKKVVQDIAHSMGLTTTSTASSTATTTSTTTSI